MPITGTSHQAQHPGARTVGLNIEELERLYP